MPPSPPSPEPPSPPPPVSAAPLLRLAPILLLALLLAAGGWWLSRPAAADRGPAAVFDYVRDRTLAGDGGALWRMMLPPARRDYEGFLKNMREGRPPEVAKRYRDRTGITPEDVARLGPEAIMAREQTALAKEMWEGSRVYDVEVRGEGAILRSTLRDGSERAWFLRLIDGAWRVDNLQAVTDAEGRYLGRADGTVPPEWRRPRQAGDGPAPPERLR
ncbi:MAG: hypothetical protein HUU06_13535 [Planctomycetaceae bacterium]|nr:hypothetical protein [Planctomycetaceae bacterium]